MSLLAVRISQDLESRLNKLTKLTGRSKSFYVKEALLEHIEDLEDYYLAEKIMKSYDRKKNKTLEELMKEYGMDH